MCASTSSRKGTAALPPSEDPDDEELTDEQLARLALRQRSDCLGAQQRVAQLEQRIGAADVAGVQLSPEAAEPREGEGWHRHGRAA